MEEIAPLTSSCCSFNNPPWLCKSNSTNDIEVQVCADESSSNEDIQVEVYIQWLHHSANGWMNMVCMHTRTYLWSN